MGCGKSLCAIELLNRWQSSRVLIAAPKAVLSVWESEFAKHSPDWKVAVLNQNSVANKRLALNQIIKNNGHEKLAIVTNYESAWRQPLAQYFWDNPPQVVIMDEVHRLKSPRGQASKFFGRLAAKCERRLGLSGTPAPHSPLDFWAVYRALDPGIFGWSYTRFRAKYAIMGGFQNHQILKFVNLEELHNRVYSIAYRCLSSDVLDLPDTLEQTIFFDLSPSAAKIYKNLERDLMAEIAPDKIISVPNVLAKLLRLQQLTGGWLKADDSDRETRVDFGKADALKDLLEDMGSEPVVVFCRFIADIKAVQIVCDALKLKWAELSGKENTLDKWLAGKAQVMICQIRSGGLGIDLTRARYSIYYSTGWSLGDLEQSKARVHRPGQERRVTYYYLTAKGTVDEKIIKALGKRADLINYVIDDLRGAKP